MKWQKKLTRSELKHLNKDAGCRTLDQVRRTIATHEEWRQNGEPEPCWTCKLIGKKLGLIEN